MSAKTNIEWCDSTFNPWVGCTKVGPGCDNCYAEALMDRRMGRVKWGASQARSRTSEAYWRQPLRWNAEADRFAQCGNCGWRGEPAAFACPSCDAVDWRPARRRVFCASLADVFDNEAPVSWLADLLMLIYKTPQLDWLLLTKRIGNVRARLIQCIDLMPIVYRPWLIGWRDGIPLANVWIGATVVNQAEADRDLPELLQVPAAKRFVSIEPMLGPVDLRNLPFGEAGPTGYRPRILDALTAGSKSATPWHLDWVICGGESGPKSRPMHPDWARSLRDQCASAGVPFFFKQWGEWRPPVDGEDFNTAFGMSGKPPAFLVSPDGTVNCFYPHGDSAVRPHDSVHKPMVRVGKRAAGRLLDGREHLEWPA